LVSGGPAGVAKKVSADAALALARAALGHPSDHARKIASWAYKHGLDAYRANYKMYRSANRRRLSSKQAQTFHRNLHSQGLMKIAKTLYNDVREYESGKKSQRSTGSMAVVEAEKQISRLAAAARTEALSTAVVWSKAVRILAESQVGLPEYPPYMRYRDAVDELGGRYKASIAALCGKSKSTRVASKSGSRRRKKVPPAPRASAATRTVKRPDRLPGQIVFLSDREMNSTQKMWIMNTDGTNQRRLVDSPKFKAGRDTAWSPGCTHIAFLYQDDVHTIDLASGAIRRVTYESRRYSYAELAWSPSGKVLAFTRSAKQAAGLEMPTVFLLGMRSGKVVRQLTRAQSISDYRTYRDLAWSPDGQRIAFSSQMDSRDMEILTISADGSGERRLTNNSVHDREPAWSPDGRRIAYVSADDIWVMDADGRNAKRMTETRDDESKPTWSSDGKHIAFSTDRHGNNELYRIEVGTGSLTRLTDKPGSDSRPRWCHNEDSPEPSVPAKLGNPKKKGSPCPSEIPDAVFLGEQDAVARHLGVSGGLIRSIYVNQPGRMMLKSGSSYSLARKIGRFLDSKYGQGHSTSNDGPTMWVAGGCRVAVTSTSVGVILKVSGYVESEQDRKARKNSGHRCPLLDLASPESAIKTYYDRYTGYIRGYCKKEAVLACFRRHFAQNLEFRNLDDNLDGLPDKYKNFNYSDLEVVSKIQDGRAFRLRVRLKTNHVPNNAGSGYDESTADSDFVYRNFRVRNTRKGWKITL